jgi:hypothetical protein
LTLTIWLNLTFIIIFTVFAIIFAMLPAWFPKAVAVVCIIFCLPMIEQPQFFLDYTSGTVTFTKFFLPTLFFTALLPIYTLILYLVTLNVFDATGRDYIGRPKRLRKK